VTGEAEVVVVLYVVVGLVGEVATGHRAHHDGKPER
jgi:hypothetical protein